MPLLAGGEERHAQGLDDGPDVALGLTGGAGMIGRGEGQEGEVTGTVTNVRKLQNAQTTIYSALSAFPDPISCESGLYTYIIMHAKDHAAMRERKEIRRGRRRRRRRNKSDGRVSKSA